MRLTRGVKITVGVVALVVLTAGILSMIPPISSSARPAPRQTVCSFNLRDIATALYSYHEDNGRFPPVYVTDGKGKPMHSWRVLLLKYLDKELYDMYEFGEPWDGPNNSKLRGKMPPVYGCPNAPTYKDLETTFTNYLAVVGPNSALQKGKSKSMSEIFIGTILIAEVANSDVHWTEPRDLDVSDIDLSAQSWDSLHKRVSSKDPDGPAVILGDLGIVRIR